MLTCICDVHVHVHMPHSGKLSREKTFMNFKVLGLSTKVLSSNTCKAVSSDDLYIALTTAVQNRMRIAALDDRHSRLGKKLTYESLFLMVIL